MNSDEKYMEIACRLAEKCNPSPNPRVGCVIVDSNVKSNNLSNNMIGEAQIISKGCHKYAGGKHAEIIAIENCKEKSHFPLAYITGGLQRLSKSVGNENKKTNPDNVGHGLVFFD